MSTFTKRVMNFLNKIGCDNFSFDLESNTIVANWAEGETFYEFDLDSQEYRHCGYGGFYTDWEEF